MQSNEERQYFINRFGPKQLEKFNGVELLKLIAAPKTTINDDLKKLFGSNFNTGYSSMYQALEEETNTWGKMNGNMTAAREIFYSAKKHCWQAHKSKISEEEAIDIAEDMRNKIITASNLLIQHKFNDFYDYANQNYSFFSKGFIHKYLYICFPQWIILGWHKTGHDADAFYKQKIGIKSDKLFSLEYYFFQKNPLQDFTGIQTKLEKEYGPYTAPTTQTKVEQIDKLQTKYPKKFPLNQILFGPPGTGKTYHTITKAVEIIEGRISENYEIDKKHFDELRESGQIQFITFHQNYSYEDFMLGIRPILNGSQIAYELHEGPFKKIADKARKDPDNNYVLIIDEINRGNISKIFGELITLIEDDKREGNEHSLSMPLMYQKDNEQDFSVPKNLYIIGTMNTADKSIALVDIALRRRFVFEEMMPKADIIPPQIGSFNLQQWFQETNNKISQIIDRDHQIGHSYFMKVQTPEQLHKIFYQCILPLLNEYCYGSPEKLQEIIPGFMEKDNDTLRVKNRLSLEDFLIALQSQQEHVNDENKIDTNA